MIKLVACLIVFLLSCIFLCFLGHIKNVCGSDYNLKKNREGWKETIFFSSWNN